MMITDQDVGNNNPAGEINTPARLTDDHHGWLRKWGTAPRRTAC